MSSNTCLCTYKAIILLRVSALKKKKYMYWTLSRSKSDAAIEMIIFEKNKLIVW